MQKIRDNLAMIWFVVSALALAVLTWVVHRKNVKISALVYDVQKSKLEAKIKTINEKAKKDNESFIESKREYAALRKRYGKLLDKYGLKSDSHHKADHGIFD